MNVLALETSGTVCSVAVGRIHPPNQATELLSVAEAHVANSHDALLSHLVSEVLSTASLSVNDVNVIAVSQGPGSFTGLRIGIAFAYGFALPAHDRTVHIVGVPTMAALAASVLETATVAQSCSIVCILPSHGDKFYRQTFSRSAVALGDVDIVTLDNIIQPIDNKALYVSTSLPPSTLPNQLTVRLSAAHILAASGTVYIDSLNASTLGKTVLPLYCQEFKPR